MIKLLHFILTSFNLLLAYITVNYMNKKLIFCSNHLGFKTIIVLMNNRSLLFGIFITFLFIQDLDAAQHSIIAPYFAKNHDLALLTI